MRVVQDGLSTQPEIAPRDSTCDIWFCRCLALQISSSTNFDGSSPLLSLTDDLSSNFAVNAAYKGTEAINCFADIQDAGQAYAFVIDWTIDRANWNS
jgi:hypothetical protein